MTTSAKDVSEFDTLDEYKKEIKDNLTKKKEEQAKTEKENAVVDKAVENATMEIPEAMIDTQVENMVDDFCKKNPVPGSVHGAVHAVYRRYR